ncbi:hypothetical protein [Rhizobium sp. NFR07]|uniref:hypothetical protein n=1 Tax=Rhizobium sp. NFR07 TaxID=1566262 RepID=UPI0011609328|nr:hypothetical protein [Rhizobium sp. NFR07]
MAKTTKIADLSAMGSGMTRLLTGAKVALAVGLQDLGPALALFISVFSAGVFANGFLSTSLAGSGF